MIEMMIAGKICIAMGSLQAMAPPTKSIPKAKK